MSLGTDRASGVRRPPWPAIGLAAAVLAVGLAESIRLRLWAEASAPALLLFWVLWAVAVGCYRTRPAVGLGLAWLAGVLQVASGGDIAVSQVSIVVLAYGAARYGHPASVLVSGLSVPAGAAAATAYVASNGSFGVSPLADVAYAVGNRAAAGWAPLVLALVLALVLLAAPWLVGLLLRVGDGARRSREARERAEQEAVRARELAAAKQEQARLARDVHDVVGHSLTVILAQADSAQFMPDRDIDSIRSTVANIAVSARRSLGDVRQVLSSTGDHTGDHSGDHSGGHTGRPAAVGELDSLVDGVRAAGTRVVDEVGGTPRPLPPELATVAFRVLQEMLTNALKHGVRVEPVLVQRDWGTDELRIRVRNVVRPDAVPAEDGQGLAGMQRRLESVGGRLEVLPGNRSPGSFVVAAWLPTRPVSTS